LARSNPCQLKRPGAVEEYREFTDPFQPGEVFGVALRAVPDSSLDYQMSEKAQRYITDYVTGRNGGPPAPLPPVDGKRVVMTEQLCLLIAGLEVMEFIPDWSRIEEIRSLPPPPEPQIDPDTGEEIEVEIPPPPPLQATDYDAPYTFDAWRAMTVTAPNAWDEIVAFANELQRKAKEATKN
jgi:hypothetical protein